MYLPKEVTPDQQKSLQERRARAQERMREAERMLQSLGFELSERPRPQGGARMGVHQAEAMMGGVMGEGRLRSDRWQSSENRREMVVVNRRSSRQQFGAPVVSSVVVAPTRTSRGENRSAAEGEEEAEGVGTGTNAEAEAGAERVAEGRIRSSGRSSRHRSQRDTASKQADAKSQQGEETAEDVVDMTALLGQ